MESHPMFSLDAFLGAIHTLPDSLLYFALGLSAFVENVFPPIPGDTITAFGAFLVGTRRLDFYGVYLSTTLGSLLGFISLFLLGGFLGRRFFMERDYRFFKARDIVKVERWFERYGYLLVLANRFLPGVRSIISLAGGMAGLKLLRVTCLAFVSAAIWNLIWIWVGYELGTNWETVRSRMASIMTHYNLTILILAAVAGAVFMLRKLYRRRSR